MTHMSLQNMNGVGTLMRRRIAGPTRLTLNDIVPPDGTPTSEDDLGLDPKGLGPNIAPWWVQPPLRRDEVNTQRGTPTPGETRKAYSADRPAFPLTPSNDARDLPNSYTGQPLRQLPRRNYPGDFPHTWIPYEELKTATGPEMGPTQPGYAPIPSEAQMRQRAFDGGSAVPWVAKDHMTHDISGLRGFASLRDIPGMTTDYDTPATQAAVAAVASQANAAQAAGASPNVVNQVIDVAAKAAALALQASGKLPVPAPAPAKASVLPSFLTSGDNKTLYVVGGLTLAGAIVAAVMAGRKKGGRRR